MEQDKKSLEKTVEEECPFVRVKNSLHFGIYMLAGEDETSYECSIDGGIARGGDIRRSIPFGASTPCNKEYAKTCPLYNEHSKGQ